MSEALTWDEALADQAFIRSAYKNEDWFRDAAIVILGDAKYGIRVIDKKAS